MRKNYVKPALIGEDFIPEVYCAACEHTSSGAGMYNFVCDAGGGEYGGLYLEDNGVDGFQKNAFCNCGENHTSKSGGSWLAGTRWECSNWISGDTRISSGTSSYHACGASHAAATTDEFPLGYFVGASSGNIVKIRLWTGDGNKHGTENLNQETWTKNIS